MASLICLVVGVGSWLGSSLHEASYPQESWFGLLYTAMGELLYTVKADSRSCKAS